MPSQPKTYEFTVSSHTEFPLDMLRYDRCWPKRESEDVLEIKRSFDQRRGPRSKFKVRLVGLKEPTIARWESFGWKVV